MSRKWKRQNINTRKMYFGKIRCTVIINELFLFVDPYMFSNKNIAWKLTNVIKSRQLYSLKVKIIFKGYLSCNITSQNVLLESQVKNIFVSKKSYVLFSRYSSFCIFNHLTIYQISEVKMSISIWDMVHFEIYFLNHNTLTH